MCLTSRHQRHLVPHEYSIFIRVEETGCTEKSKGMYRVGSNNQEKEREGQSRVESCNKDLGKLSLLFLAVSGQRSMHDR